MGEPVVLDPAKVVAELRARIAELESENKSLLEANRELRDAALGRTEFSR